MSRSDEGSSGATGRPFKPLTRNMRIWFWIDCLLLTTAGVQLYILAEATDRFFAWTIAPPLTAAFLGASYLGSLPLVYLSSRQKLWANARLAVYGVFVFTVVTLMATLMHLDRFHLSASLPFARFAAWVWLLIYVTVPPSLIVLTLLQWRVPGVDPSRVAPLAGWLRGALALQAATLLLVGVALFAYPTGVPWPWMLTPLTGRAVAAWLIGIGVILAHMVWENEYSRVRNAMLSLALVAALQLGGLARFAATVNWGYPATGLYLFFLLSAVAVGMFGWLTARSIGANSVSMA
jgi:hypothetical protein